MSFMLTPRQLCDGSKTVTRRLGWLKLVEATARGEVPQLLAVSKCMGLKKGERATVFGIIEVPDARREPLNLIDREDVIREGFPDLTPSQFVEFFCDSHRGCQPETVITRIEVRQVGDWSTEQTEGEFTDNGHSMDWLLHSGKHNDCYSSNMLGERDIFRCSRCYHWCCDCIGGSGDMCSPCWYESELRETP